MPDRDFDLASSLGTLDQCTARKVATREAGQAGIRPVQWTGRAMPSRIATALSQYQERYTQVVYPVGVPGEGYPGGIPSRCTGWCTSLREGGDGQTARVPSVTSRMLGRDLEVHQWCTVLSDIYDILLFLVGRHTPAIWLTIGQPDRRSVPWINAVRGELGP